MLKNYFQKSLQLQLFQSLLNTRKLKEHLKWQDQFTLGLIVIEIILLGVGYEIMSQL
jgi:hypothetical protein